MNTLSWLIYGADLAGNVQGASSVLCIGGVAGYGLYRLVSAIEPDFSADPAKRWDADLREHRRWPSLYAKPEGERPQPGKRPVWIAWVVSISLVLSVVTPSRNTLYAIAASEMGERALQTATASKAVQALNAWLDKQITPSEAK
jgi:hypothetical protein